MGITQQWSEQTYSIPIDATQCLAGFLNIPEQPYATVLFVHGSGSSRRSPRNQLVARGLHDAGFATLLIDLLTESEEVYDLATARLRFNIPFLSERVRKATDWLKQQPITEAIPTGYFGASTGAAAALVAASDVTNTHIQAVVSRGGRPDLAASVLPLVQSPTLLIVGGQDPEVLKLNRQAYQQLHTEKALEIVPGATHLFEETGALEQVINLARNWFLRYLH